MGVMVPLIVQVNHVKDVAALAFGLNAVCVEVITGNCTKATEFKPLPDPVRAHPGTGDRDAPRRGDKEGTWESECTLGSTPSHE